MIEWWGSLTGDEQVFFGIAFLSTGFMAIQLLLNLMGLAAAELDVEVGDVDDPSGLGLLSLRTILAFLVGFGWGGAAMAQEGYPLPKSMPIATVSGIIFLLSVFFLMRFLHGLSESGNVEVTDKLKGKSGTVYLKIPSKREGNGQVQILVQGRLREVSAVTDGDEIATGVSVEVLEVLSGDVLLVQKGT